MANVISLQFNGEVTLKHYSEKYVINTPTPNDLVYALGTDFGTTSFTNPFSTEFTSGDFNSNQFDRSLSTTGRIFFGGGKELIFNNYVFLPTRIVTYGDIPIGNTIGLSLHNGSTFVQVATVAGVGTTYYSFIVDPRNAFYTDKILLDHISGATTAYCNEIQFYGILKRKNGGDVASTEGSTTLLQVPNNGLVKNEVGAAEPGDFLTSDVNSYTHRSTTRIMATGSITIGNKQQFIVIVIDPNGANRDVILTQNPIKDTQYRIINADGANALNIKETSGGPTLVTLSNGAGVLTADVFWDNIDTYHITA